MAWKLVIPERSGAFGFAFSVVYLAGYLTCPAEWFKIVALVYLWNKIPFTGL